MQIVAAEEDAPLIVKDYRNLPAERRTCGRDGFHQGRGPASFDLERGPLLRVLLMRRRRSVATV